MRGYCARVSCADIVCGSVWVLCVGSVCVCVCVCVGVLSVCGYCLWVVYVGMSLAELGLAGIVCGYFLWVLYVGMSLGEGRGTRGEG